MCSSTLAVKLCRLPHLRRSTALGVHFRIEFAGEGCDTVMNEDAVTTASHASG